MTSLTRDRDYATFVEDERSLLQRCAYLLVGRREAADELVQASLADLYARWRRVRDPRLVALRLLHTTDLGALPDSSPRARFELLDTGRGPREVVDPLVTLLGTLSARQRLVVVLEWVARLPSVEIAAVLDSTVATVADVSRDARAALVRAVPGLADDAELARRLDQAVPPDVRSVRRYDDLTHGQQLVRRRWLRRAGVAAAAVVLLVLLVGQLRPVAQTPVSAPAAPGGDLHRHRHAGPHDRLRPHPGHLPGAARPHLAGHRVRGGRRLPRPRGRVLQRLELLRPRRDRGAVGHQAAARSGWRCSGWAAGATQVTVQIATDRSYAPRCGEATGNPCSSIRFMDGNRFILSDDGLEGQYRPDGRDVITVVAENTGRGERLAIDRAQLVRLLQDDRLRLPPL